MTSLGFITAAQADPHDALPDPPRTRGMLPVQQQLRPKPAAWQPRTVALEFRRTADGSYNLGTVPLRDAFDYVVAGEA